MLAAHSKTGGPGAGLCKKSNSRRGTGPTSRVTIVVSPSDAVACVVESCGCGSNRRLSFRTDKLRRWYFPADNVPRSIIPDAWTIATRVSRTRGYSAGASSWSPTRVRTPRPERSVTSSIWSGNIELLNNKDYKNSTPIGEGSQAVPPAHPNTPRIPQNRLIPLTSGSTLPTRRSRHRSGPCPRTQRRAPRSRCVRPGSRK